MPDVATIKRELPIRLTPADIAEAFCELDDDAQAQVFCHIARIMHTWQAHARVMQLHYVGRHLATCVCVTPEARDLIDDIHSSMHQGEVTDGSK